MMQSYKKYQKCFCLNIYIFLPYKIFRALLMIQNIWKVGTNVSPNSLVEYFLVNRDGTLKFFPVYNNDR